ncbi:MAG: hypothetical protein HKP13_10905 [Gammaproteobacteria bacterium]|nr:hypothetical protein [Gammaproteobacteria bacterium]
MGRNLPITADITLTYRKNKDPGKSDARIKAQPLSALARSANMFTKQALIPSIVEGDVARHGCSVAGKMPIDK